MRAKGENLQLPRKERPKSSVRAVAALRPGLPLNLLIASIISNENVDISQKYEYPFPPFLSFALNSMGRQTSISIITAGIS